MKGSYPKEAPVPDLRRPNFGEADEDIKIT